MNIKDIARLSGVGVSTVSRVINDHPDVKKETRDIIKEIIKEYNYIPNNSARILKQSNTKNIGVLVKGVFNPFFSEMLKTIGARIEEIGYTMILNHYDKISDTSDIDTLISFIKEKRLQGVICLGGNFESINEDYFEGLEVSIVLTSINTAVKTSKNIFSVIGIDNEKAAYGATEYLINNGHKDIAFIIGDEFDAGVGNVRTLGYIKALEDYNISVRRDYILLGGYDFEPAYKATQQLLEQNTRVTGIFAISDIMAVGACKAIIDKGLKVPEDISVMGFDGMDIAKFYNPSLTTIKQPKRKMAEKSVDLLFELLSHKSDNKQIILETKLVEGNSCRKI